MAEFTPSQKTAQDFNNGIEYVDGIGDIEGDAVHAESINSVIEGLLYTQGLAVNAPDVSEANQVGVASVSVVTTSDGTAQLKFSNLKGENGKGISSTTISYATTTSGTITPADSAWQSTIPDAEKGSYLWTRTVITYTDGTSSTSYTSAYQGVDGQGSQDASAEDGTKIYYYPVNPSQGVGQNYSVNAIALIPQVSLEDVNLNDIVIFANGKIAYVSQITTTIVTYIFADPNGSNVYTYPLITDAFVENKIVSLTTSKFTPSPTAKKFKKGEAVITYNGYLLIVNADTATSINTVSCKMIANLNGADGSGGEETFVGTPEEIIEYLGSISGEELVIKAQHCIMSFTDNTALCPFQDYNQIVEKYNPFSPNVEVEEISFGVHDFIIPEDIKNQMSSQTVNWEVERDVVKHVIYEDYYTYSGRKYAILTNKYRAPLMDCSFIEGNAFVSAYDNAFGFGGSDTVRQWLAGMSLSDILKWNETLTSNLDDSISPYNASLFNSLTGDGKGLSTNVVFRVYCTDTQPRSVCMLEIPATIQWISKVAGAGGAPVLLFSLDSAASLVNVMQDFTPGGDLSVTLNNLANGATSNMYVEIDFGNMWLEHIALKNYQ